MRADRQGTTQQCGGEHEAGTSHKGLAGLIVAGVLHRARQETHSIGIGQGRVEYTTRSLRRRAAKGEQPKASSHARSGRNTRARPTGTAQNHTATATPASGPRATCPQPDHGRIVRPAVSYRPRNRGRVWGSGC
ncbi:MAG: hypothetical protein ACK55I_26890, partial [bacterium]